MTMVELMIALVVFGVIMTGALRFMSVQNTALRQGLDRSEAIQAARFSLQALETDLKTAGTNVAPGQPSLVVAGADVLAFNADYATNISGDPFAVFYDPDAPSGQVTVSTSPIRVPNTGFDHPDTTYLVGGGMSPAELLIFYFIPDTTTSRGDDFALYRQVNSAEPELVARDLLQPDGAPFFRYMRLSGEVVDSVPDGDLPLTHSVPIHLSPPDTGALAVIDSIRGVRVTVKASNGRSGAEERTAELSRIISFPNAGQGVVQSCGSSPILGSAPTASLTSLPSGDDAVDLTWAPAVDESGGEGDVIRYVIWRREAANPDWGDPYLSIPAGNPAYSYTDAGVESGKVYRYGLAAQDCTPNLSPIAASAAVAIP